MEIAVKDLRICLEVLARVEELPVEHPDAVAVRRATARIFKTVKERRRSERRAAASAEYRSVLAKTATAAPGRIDDETSGVALTASASGGLAGSLIRARPCYQCKAKYTAVGAYAALVAGESEALPSGLSFRELGSAHELHAGSTLALTAGNSAIDAGGLIPDVVDHNSWTEKVQEIDPVQMLEVQLCNSVAPFLLISRLRASLAASSARRTYIVNVPAMEGSFARGYKGPGHPHTNMAKAALNMLTRTSARELLAADGILMTSVDTGWIADERPHTTRQRLAEQGFHAPLDLADGAARVYDPIVRGEAGEDLHGVFLKDYAPTNW